MVERDLFDIEDLLGSKGRVGVLFRIENDVPEEARELLIEKIIFIRQEIKKIAGQFSLEKETISLKQKLGGKLSLLGVDVEEIESKRLRGYGEVAEGLAEALDPQLSAIKENIYKMLKFLRGETEE